MNPEDGVWFDECEDEEEPIYCDCPGHACSATVSRWGERCPMCAEACPPSCPV